MRLGSSARRAIAVTTALLVVGSVVAPAAGADGPRDMSDYSVVGESGSEIYVFGDATFIGSLEQHELESHVAGIAPHPGGDGYWLATGDGDVHAFGVAEHRGDASALSLAGEVVDIAATPSGLGYWIVGSDGGVMTFGDAGFFGSTGGIDLVAPVVAIEPTPTGDGYWLAAGDGGVFAFGDAQFHGSAGGFRLDQPVTAMVATSTGSGYWLMSSDGGVFAFGDALFMGSRAGQLDGEDIVDAARSPSGVGYWLVGDRGTVAAFGSAIDLGGLAAAADEPVAGIASTPSGGGYWLVTTPGRDSAGPPVPEDSGTGRRIVYSNSGQRVWVIEDGERVVTSYLVSGKKFVPKPGNYEVYSKSPLAWAGYGGITMEYMVRFAYGKRLAIGFHSIPKYSNGDPMQTPEQLGSYQSSGCVRQHVDQARFLYDWADLGTPVIVLP